MTNETPGLWSRLRLRWRVWRRDEALMQLIARTALLRCGVCDESDSLVRIAWDARTGQLIVMVYLAQFDHAVWAMSRHIEAYLMRQFKGLYGITVHSVHVDVIRARAFKEQPAIKSASSMRAVLRERRAAGVHRGASTGRRIQHSVPPPAEDADGFAPTARSELTELDRRLEVKSDPPAAPHAAAGIRSPMRGMGLLHMEEYLTEPGYEVSEVEFEEFINSMPGNTPPASMQTPPPPSGAAASARDGATGANFNRTGAEAPFVAEADLVKRERS